MPIRHAVFLPLFCFAMPVLAQQEPINHDAEYYILEAQNAEQWSQDDAEVDARLAAFNEANGGKPPNILYILLEFVISYI